MTMIDDSKPKHYIKLRGKIIELTDAEYAARAERIEEIRSVKMRLISSGIFILKLRRPAST